VLVVAGVICLLGQRQQSFQWYCSFLCGCNIGEFLTVQLIGFDGLPVAQPIIYGILRGFSLRTMFTLLADARLDRPFYPQK
jgi:hypothetical protein